MSQRLDVLKPFLSDAQFNELRQRLDNVVETLNSWVFNGEEFIRNVAGNVGFGPANVDVKTGAHRRKAWFRVWFLDGYAWVRISKLNKEFCLFAVDRVQFHGSDNLLAILEPYAGTDEVSVLRERLAAGLSQLSSLPDDEIEIAKVAEFTGFDSDLLDVKRGKLSEAKAGHKAGRPAKQPEPGKNLLKVWFTVPLPGGDDGPTDALLRASRVLGAKKDLTLDRVILCWK